MKDKIAKLEADIAASKAPAAQQQHGAAVPAKDLGVEFPSVKDKVVKLEADIAASKAPAAQQQYSAAAPAKNLGVEFPSVKDKVVKLEADIAASKAPAAQQQHGAAAPAKDLGVEFPSVKDKVVKLEADIAASKALAAQQVEQQMGDIRSAHTYHLQGMNKLFGEQNTQAAAGTAQPGSHDQVQSGQVNGNATKYQTQMDELTAMQQQTAIDSARVQAHQGQQALQALIMDGILAQMRRISDAIKALGQLG
ncbi:hypothetical protein LT85_0490 [Collimonas arenae]|uniref:Uncharacterized protein n=1 Tax=Collimonas arenae TaxID=279058 RepID=A0A0A1F775_9BURK|nr:hypothetical protein LT85_0490 [Collimonas arenae]